MPTLQSTALELPRLATTFFLASLVACSPPGVPRDTPTGGTNAVDAGFAGAGGHAAVHVPPDSGAPPAGGAGTDAGIDAGSGGASAGRGGGGVGGAAGV